MPAEGAPLEYGFHPITSAAVAPAYLSMPNVENPGNPCLLNRADFQRNLNRFLLIFSALILSWRVEGGMPSFAAAPDGPETRPLVSASAASIISRSLSAST